MKSNVQSMTGFGRGESIGNQFTLTTEIKSVNNRFKDIRFKMSSLFNAQEISWRSMLENEVKRGTFDIYISYQKKSDVSSDFNIDPTKIKNYLQKIKDIVGKDIPLNVNPVDFLKSDFNTDEAKVQEEMIGLAEDSFKKALKNLKESRLIEGGKLILKIKDHLSIYQSKLEACKNLAGKNPEQLKDKLVQKLNEKMKEFKIDEGRLLQEVLFYIEKLDVDEELNRANIHLKKFDEILSASGEMGRQIDFLLQELGRETNTLGSKTNSLDVSHLVVDMKVQLEKIREQALNLE